jgi:LDH2 family malate/lactate/ureidoglycolate dehydrogenase
LFSEGKKLPGDWVQEKSGRATNDPAVLFTEPPGTNLPIGGKEYGHKGFGLALMIEALTQGLSGLGRADPPEGWGAAVYLKVTDPSAFGGMDEFTRQTSWLAESCRNNPPAEGVANVRLPGDNAILNKAEAIANGLELYPGLLDNLKTFSDNYNILVPEAI